MKEIILTNGNKTLVDDSDFEVLNQWKWHESRGYAIRFIGTARKNQKCLRMHTSILIPIKGFEIDHINRNRLDNRYENLRLVTRQQNMMNQTKAKNKSSIYKGVCWVKREHNWLSSISLNKKFIRIGQFKSELHAAMAYDIWAKELFGEYAKTNF